MIEAALLAAVVVHSRGRAAVAGSLMQERAAMYDEHDRAHAVRAERSRWLEEHGSVASFAAGVVRPAPPRPDLPAPAIVLPREVPVTAAIVPEAFVFLLDPPAAWVSAAPIEAGSIPRTGISVEVLRNDGAEVERPAAESFDPELEANVIIAWQDGTQGLVFRSAWLAWRAADRFREGAVR